VELTKEQLTLLNSIPIASWDYPRILVGIPLERAISHADEVFWAFINIAMQIPAFVKMPYQRTDLYRNKAAEKLLASNATHLLMLDLDHIHPPDIIQRLAQWVLMDDNIKIVGGLNFRRGAPYEPCAFIKGDDGDIYAPADWHQGLIEVDYLGTGSILIDREVFESIDPPWFYNDYSEAWHGHYPGEDMGFSIKAKAAGFRLLVDTTTTSPHMITRAVDENTFRQHLAQNPGRLIDIASNEKLTAEEIAERKLTA